MTTRRSFLQYGSALLCACATPMSAAARQSRFPRFKAELAPPSYAQVALSPGRLQTQLSHQHSLFMGIDNDRLLGAINGVYLLSAVRDSRDSLALNAVFDQAWSQTGQALELHVQRNLELLRQNPADPMTAARLDAAIKMAEIRFNADYAETLKRARATAERRS